MKKWRRERREGTERCGGRESGEGTGGHRRERARHEGGEGYAATGRRWLRGLSLSVPSHGLVCGHSSVGFCARR